MRLLLGRTCKMFLWRQKLRVKWIKGGYNSKFFHRVTNGRRNKKFIKSLVSEEGVTRSNIEII